MKTYKVSINPAHIVSRVIEVSWNAPEQVTQAVDTLNECNFVQSASYDAARAELSIEYDAGQRDLSAVEALVRETGGRIPGGLRHRLTRFWLSLKDHGKGGSGTIELEDQVHCHTIAQKKPNHHSGWRTWPGD